MSLTPYQLNLNLTLKICKRTSIYNRDFPKQNFPFLWFKRVPCHHTTSDEYGRVLTLMIKVFKIFGQFIYVVIFNLIHLY